MGTWKTNQDVYKYVRQSQAFHGEIVEGRPLALGKHFFFLPRNRLTKDDIYISLKPLIFSFIICQSLRPFHSMWNVCTHLMILSPNTHHSLYSLMLLRLLISSINVTHCAIAWGSQGISYHPDSAAPGKGVPPTPLRQGESWRPSPAQG